MTPETTAVGCATPATPARPRPSLACITAWDLAKASLRMALAAQLPEAAAVHYRTAAASAALARSLASPN